MTNMLIPQDDTTRERPNKVTGVTPIQTYLVQYTDQEGKRQVRLVMREPGSKTCFILAEKIQGSHVATSSKEWFRDEVSHAIARMGGSNEGDIESV